jgi:electron transfer flavoprotein beta subunit
MKYVVCVKLTPDTEELGEVRAEDIAGTDLGVTMALNPWDEFAVEEALALQEDHGGDTVAITLGSDESSEALKRAVAMGIEETMLLSDPVFDGSDAWGVAYALARAIESLGEYDLILTGRQSVDGNSGLVPAGIAVQLGVPFIAQVAKVLELTEDHVTVLRALEDGVQTVQVPLPAVLAVSKEINEPRYPNFMGIRKASRAQYPATAAADIPELDTARVGVSSALLDWTDVRKPPARVTTCEMLSGATAAEQAAELVERLIADKVI